jgi:hypothetical protein
MRGHPRSGSVTTVKALIIIVAIVALFSFVLVMLAKRSGRP